MMTIRQNPDIEHATKVRERLRENNYYCPCKLDKDDSTKCLCKEFRDQLDRKESGMCRCGLYVAEVD